MATEGATVFQTYQWFESWWRAFGHDRELFLVTAWDGDRLTGIAPMMIDQRYGIRCVEFVGTPNADYQDLILGPQRDQALVEFARFLADAKGSWDMLVLRNVPTDSTTFRRLPELMRGLEIRVTDFERVSCPTLELSSQPEAVRKKADGYGFRRRLRRLQKTGDVVHVRCTTPQQIEHYLPLFFDQYTQRRRGTRAERTFARDEFRTFYSLLAESLLPAGWLHFSVLECDGSPVAFHFGFEFRGRLYWYKPSFDPALSHASPGTVLLAYLIRDATERSLLELDFTVGSEPFKYRYANTQRTNANLRAFSRRWLYWGFSTAAYAHKTVATMLNRPRI